jgi:hypothetical protein
MNYRIIAFLSMYFTSCVVPSAAQTFAASQVVATALEQSLFAEGGAHGMLRSAPPLVIDVPHALAMVARVVPSDTGAAAVLAANPQRPFVRAKAGDAVFCAPLSNEAPCAIASGVGYATICGVERSLGSSDTLRVWVCVSQRGATANTVSSYSREVVFRPGTGAAWVFVRLGRGQLAG